MMRTMISPACSACFEVCKRFRCMSEIMLVNYFYSSHVFDNTWYMGKGPAVVLQANTRYHR